MFRNDLLSSSPLLLLSVSTFILLCYSPTTNSNWVHPTILTSFEEARSWMNATLSTAKREESLPYNVSSFLGYLL
jgi:hypothetical protein